MNEVTQELVKELFEYKDGKLFWKKVRSNAVKIGDEAGTCNNVGYRQISITTSNKKYIVLTHRLIYLYHFGYFPKEIDHINLNKLDNRIENLREATRSQNIVNNTARQDSSSGYRGIYFCKKNKRWIARIWLGGKCIWRKGFNSLENAVQARKNEISIHYQEFARI